MRLFVLSLATFATLASARVDAAANDPPRGIGELAQPMRPHVSRCFIQSHPQMVAAWIETLPGTEEEQQLVRENEAKFPACFGEVFSPFTNSYIGQYNISGMRAALIRRLLQVRKERLSDAGLPNLDKARWYVNPSNPVWEQRPDAVIAADLGVCLARKHWNSAISLVTLVDPRFESAQYVNVATRAARKREGVAVDANRSAFIPAISGCVPAGTKVTLDKARLRSLVEEAVLHLSESGEPIP